MSVKLQIILTVLVVAADLFILRQIRHKRMSLNYSLLWLSISLLLLIMILFPGLIDRLADLVGITLPINMLFLGFSVFAMMMLFSITGIVSVEHAKTRRLAQQLALLEKRVRELEGETEKKDE